MSPLVADSWWSRSAVSLQLSVLGAALGAVLGLGGALGKIAANSYWGLGFRRTIFIELRDTATDYSAVGLMLALGALGSWWLVHRLLPASRRFLRPSFLTDIARQRVLRWRLSALILGLEWLVVTVTAYLNMPRSLVPAAVTSGVLGLLLVWGSASVARRFQDRAAGPHAERSQAALEALLGATYASVALGVAGAFLQNRTYLDGAIPRPDVYANLALLAAVGLTFRGVRCLVLTARPSPSPLVAVALLGAAWLATPLLSRPSLRAGHPQSVILIGIDTLRMDDTSLVAGTARDLTPNLRRLADGGASFSHAVSQAPWTMPAFASIITGRYPQEHGAASLTGRLDERALTLAELLREAGYRSSGIVAHRFVDSKRGFAQGFSAYDEENAVGHVGITSARITDLALDFLPTSAEQPFFLFLHYFDPHYLYEDHPDWKWADGYQGWLRGPHNDFGNLRAKRHLLEVSDLRYLRDLYHEEIAATDHQIGRLLDGISTHGLDDDVAVIVVADHGEEFMEHGWLGHTISLYDEVIRVPLVMRIPGVAGGSRIDRPVETRQIFSTVLDYLQLKGVDRGLRRESLLPLLLEDRGPQVVYRGPEAAFSAALLADAPIRSGKRIHLFAMQEKRWKLILDATRGQELLFDLERDPLEKTDLAAIEHEKLGAMRQRLQGWIQDMNQTDGPARELELTEEEIEQLKALGYL